MITALVVGGLAVMVVAGSWIASGKTAPKPGTGKPASGRLTVSEMAAMAVLGGVEAPEKPKLPNSLRQAPDGVGASAREKALLTTIETGSEAEAAKAIRELAALGGPMNHRRLTAIMNDHHWPDALRTEAARALLASDDPIEAVLAVRALAVIGGDANTDALNAMINNTSLPDPVRLEAALGMGTIGSPRARDALINAYAAFPEPEIREQLLGALAKYPFPQIEATWRQVLGDPTTPDEVRAAAAEALANSTPDALPFLKTMAGSDRDPNVREMAAWAISTLPVEDGTMGLDLARMASAEPEVDVRRRLYEALSTQATNPAESLLPLIQSETDLDARVAGFNALGDAVKRGTSSSLTEQFNTQIIPELTEIAESEDSLNIRMRAVFALRRADTDAAREALQVISQTPNQKIAVAALHGLQSPK